MKNIVQRIKNKARPPLWIFQIWNRHKPHFICPICNYEGPFRDVKGFAGVRKHAECPKCGALERHRLQYHVVKNLLGQLTTKNMAMLHFAPEPFLRKYFSRQFSRYETADLCMKGVNFHVDIQQLPFEDGSYDFIYASHVLEHIPNDQKAIQEIRRVLKPDGIAILPVPVVCEKTIEYSAPNPLEADHVRAPGLDYFDKYKQRFQRVDLHTSDKQPEQFQLFIYEDRSVWPTRECPLRPPMRGERHVDVVPVCYA